MKPQMLIFKLFIGFFTEILSMEHHRTILQLNPRCHTTLCPLLLKIKASEIKCTLVPSNPQNICIKEY